MRNNSNGQVADNTSQQRFLSDAENTMSEKVCTPIFAALLLMQKNHTMPENLGSEETLETAFLKFLKKLLEHGIIGQGKTEQEAENEAEGFQAKVMTRALEAAGGLDHGKVYDPVTKTEIVCKMSLATVLTILFVALEDETQKYWKSPYRDRLSKFYKLLKNTDARCHTGLRNDWVKGLFHGIYADLYFVEELGGTLQQFASEFFEEKLTEMLSSQPEQGFRVLCQWLDDKNPEEKPEFESFIKEYSAECSKMLKDVYKKSPLRIFLETRLEKMGLNPGDTTKNRSKPYERSVSEILDDTVKYCESLSCPRSPAHTKLFEIMSEIFEDKKKSNLPQALKSRFANCKKLEDITEQGIDVWRDIIYLRGQAAQYQFAFPVGQEAKALLDFVTIFLRGVDELLKDPETDWSKHRKTHDTCENNLEDFVAQYKKQNNHFDLIRNSFAVSRDIDRNRVDAFCKEISDAVKIPGVWITDDMLNEWEKSCLVKEGAQDVFALQQYDVARLCWQALIISPARWSSIFRDFFETRIIPIIEKPAENDSLHAEVINTSYKHLLAQFKALLTLSKMPVCQKFPEVLPWNSEGVYVIRNPKDLKTALEMSGIEKLTLIQALNFSNTFFNNVEELIEIQALFPKETWSEALPYLLNFGSSELLKRDSAFESILKSLPIEKRWFFMLSVRQIPIPRSVWPWKAWSLLTNDEKFSRLSPLIAPLDRLELFKQIYELDENTNELVRGRVNQGGFAQNPASLHTIFCEIPEEHWTALLAVINPTNFITLSGATFANFLNFLPKRFLPSFFKWLGDAKREIIAYLAEFLKKFHKKKRIFVLKTLFELVDETTLFVPESRSVFLNAFLAILPSLEPEEKTEILKLIASRIPLFASPDVNHTFVKELSEEERLQFIEFLSETEALPLQFLQYIPKTHWTALATRTGFTKRLADGDPRDLWAFVPPHLWEEVIKHFEIDLERILANPLACAATFKAVPNSELPRVERLLGPGKKWISLINSFEKLCEFIKASSHIQKPREFSIVFTVLGDDLSSLISTKENILTLWELNPRQYESLMIAVPVEDFLISFEDYLPFLQKMQELKFHPYEMINFLIFAFAYQPQALNHLEKILLCFEAKEHEQVTSDCLALTIDNLKASADNFHMALYQAVGNAHWQAALKMAHEIWGELKPKHELTLLSTSVIPFLQQSPLEAPDRLLQICRAHLDMIPKESDFFPLVFNACPAVRTLDVFKKIIGLGIDVACRSALLSISHWEHLPMNDALSVFELMLENLGSIWSAIRDSYEKLNSLFAPMNWMRVVITKMRKRSPILNIPIDILRKMHLDLSETQFSELFDIQDPKILEDLSKVRDFDESMAEYGGRFLHFSFAGSPSVRWNGYDFFEQEIAGYPEKIPFLKALSRQVGASQLGGNAEKRFSIFWLSNLSSEFFSLFKNTEGFCSSLVEKFIEYGAHHESLRIFFYNNINAIFSSNEYFSSDLLIKLFSLYTPEGRIDIFSRLPRHCLVLCIFLKYSLVPQLAKYNPSLLKTLRANFETESVQQKILDFYASRTSKIYSQYSNYFMYYHSEINHMDKIVGFKPNSKHPTFFGELVDLFEPLLKPPRFTFRTSPIPAQAQKIIEGIGKIESQFKPVTEAMYFPENITKLTKEIDNTLLNYLGAKLQEIEMKEEYSAIAMALHFAIVLVGFKDLMQNSLGKTYYLPLEKPAQATVVSEAETDSTDPIIERISGADEISQNPQTFFFQGNLVSMEGRWIIPQQGFIQEDPSVIRAAAEALRNFQGNLCAPNFEQALAEHNASNPRPLPQEDPIQNSNINPGGM